MPLSEEELRLLEQMERALAQEDPKFVSTIQGTTIERVAKTRALIAGAVFVIGVGLLLGGAMAQQTWLAVLGFVVMLGSAVIGLTAWRGRHASTPEVSNDPMDGLLDSSWDRESDRFRLIEGGRAPKRPKPGRTPKASGPSGSFMQRMEQRWQRRRNNRGY